MRAATWNVHKCVGTDGRFDPVRVTRLALALGADLLALQEVDRRLGRRSSLLKAEDFERAGMRPAKGVKGTRSDSMGWHGNVLFLSRDMEEIETLCCTLPGLEPRGMILSVLRHVPSRRTVACCAAHLGLTHSARLLQSEFIARLLLDGTVRADVRMFMGDTNEWRSDSPDRSSLRPLLDAGLSGHRLRTFPANRPLVALDRILSDRPFSLGTPACAEHALASDHRPVSGDFAAQDASGRISVLATAPAP